MCPPSSIPILSEINEYLTNEGICLSLLNFKNGIPLSLNVTSYVNPYHFRPSDLPENLWYFCSRVKKDAECGFWVDTGEACEIFSNSAILGLRTTLRFYEGRAPHGRKTDWVMQEYTINEKRNDDVKDHRALCRVFLADESRPPPGPCIANIDVKNSVNLENTLDNKSSDHFLEDSSETDCISRGDYFELNDLVDPLSRSSSSADSSCLTMTSDECFDSMALLQELEGDITNQVTNDSTFVSLRNDRLDDRNNNTSDGVSALASTSSSEGRTKKKRKLMQFICFLAF